MEAFEILVVILSTLLAIFLVIAIAVAIRIMQVVRKFNDTLEKLDKFTNSLGANLLVGLRKNINFSTMVSAAFTAARKAYKKREKSKEDEKDEL